MNVPFGPVGPGGPGGPFRLFPLLCPEIWRKKTDHIESLMSAVFLTSYYLARGFDRAQLFLN